MMISSEQLRAMLHNVVERNPWTSVWQKTQGGYLVRFFGWKNAATRNS